MKQKKNQLTPDEISERIASLQVEIDTMESQINDLTTKAIEQSVDENVYRSIHDKISEVGRQLSHKRNLIHDLQVLRDRAVEEERLQRLEQLRKKEHDATMLLESETPVVRDLLKKEEDRHRKAIIEMKDRILSIESDSLRAMIELVTAQREDYLIRGVTTLGTTDIGAIQNIPLHIEQRLKGMKQRLRDSMGKVELLRNIDLPLFELERI